MIREVSEEGVSRSQSFTSAENGCIEVSPVSSRDPEGLRARNGSAVLEYDQGERDPAVQTKDRQPLPALLQQSPSKLDQIIIEFINTTQRTSAVSELEKQEGSGNPFLKNKSMKSGREKGNAKRSFLREADCAKGQPLFNGRFNKRSSLKNLAVDVVAKSEAQVELVASRETNAETTRNNLSTSSFYGGRKPQPAWFRREGHSNPSASTVGDDKRASCTRSMIERKEGGLGECLESGGGQKQEFRVSRDLFARKRTEAEGRASRPVRQRKQGSMIELSELLSASKHTASKQHLVSQDSYSFNGEGRGGTGCRLKSAK